MKNYSPPFALRTPGGKMLWIALSGILFILVPHYAGAQSWMPVLTDELGHVYDYVYPIHDSMYIKNEIIIKFRKNVLNLEEYCYQYPSSPKKKEDRELQNGMIRGGDPVLKQIVMAQRFPVDGGLILDTMLVNVLQGIGGVQLRRMSFANPCHDTISINRYGDTLSIDHFNWMVLELDNDSIAQDAAVALTIFFSNSIEIASLNFRYQLTIHPSDGDYAKGWQHSLSSMIGMPQAWDWEQGKYEIKAAVIDNGVDYTHCDLGGNIGEGEKVSGGYNYTENNRNIHHHASHGTPAAGIIGALTNNDCVGGAPAGVAGIAGGWHPNSMGVQLVGFRTARSASDNDELTTANVVAAIQDAISDNPESGYGHACHILSNSYRLNELDPTLDAAIWDSYVHGVSFVASRGNDRSQAVTYPSGYEERMVISVGASGKDKHRIAYSSYGATMDIIAPGGSMTDRDEQIVWTTKLGGSYQWFQGTSAAAPHAAGVVALLRSDAIERGIHGSLYPEDYDGMLKASAEDMTSTAKNELVGYDDETAWGHLQADNVFAMLNDGFRISHFTLSSDFTYDEFTGDMFNRTFTRSSLREPYIEPGEYRARRRTIRGTIKLPTDKWDLTNGKLYVWGSGGGRGEGGFSSANPNPQIPFTIVRSGLGDNDHLRMVGIQHAHSLNVEVETFQYEVYDKDLNFKGIYPPLEDIVMSISVFGKEQLSSSVRIADEPAVALDISPNPVKDNLTIRFGVETRGMVEISLYNSFGELVTVSSEENLEPGEYTKEIRMENLPSGMYLCRMVSGGKAVSRPVVLQR